MRSESEATFKLLLWKKFRGVKGLAQSQQAGPWPSWHSGLDPLASHAEIGGDQGN